MTATDYLAKTTNALPAGLELHPRFLIALGVWAIDVAPHELDDFGTAVRALSWAAVFGTIAIATCAISHTPIPTPKRIHS